MTPDERELRSALAARSQVPSPAFRERLSLRLADGRPPTSLRPAAALAAGLLVVAAVGALLVTRHVLAPAPVGQHHPVVRATVSPSPEAILEPSPTPTPEPSPLLTPGVPVYPTNVDVSAAGGALWDYLPQFNLLYRSTDAGSTWQQRPAPPGIGMPPLMSFVSSEVGWFLSTGSPGTQCTPEIVTSIQFTQDGGATWSAIHPTGIGQDQCKQNLSFIDSSHGFLAAGDPNSPPVIYRTSDGGRSWSASPALADPPGYHSGTGGFELSAGTVRAFGSTLLVTATGQSTDGTQRAYVFRSLNGGATWGYLATVPQPFDVGFASASRWVLFMPRFLETTDSGASWHAFSTDYGQAAPVGPELLFDGSAAYAVISTRGEIQRSLDGGVHWTSAKMPGT